MKLRLQLLLVSLFTLAIPWAGYQFIGELEQTLRQNQQRNLLDYVQLVAAQPALHQSFSSPLNSHPYRPVYAFNLPSTMILDGYDDDWQAAGGQPIPSGRSSEKIATIHYRAGIQQSRLFLFLYLPETTFKYRQWMQPLNKKSDGLRIRSFNDQGEATDFLLSPMAPGALAIKDTSLSASLLDLKGFWQDTGNGYQVEMSLPLHVVNGGLGFSLIQGQEWAGNVSPEEKNILPSLVYRQSGREQAMRSLTPANTRLTWIHHDHWILAQTGETRPDNETLWQEDSPYSLARSLLLGIFRWVVGRDQPLFNEQSEPGQRNNPVIAHALQVGRYSGWFQHEQEGHAILAAAITLPSPDGEASVLLAEQTTDEIASLSDQAMVRLISLSFGLVLLIIGVLLGFAALLSWRIRHLRNQIHQAMDRDGRLQARFTPSRSQDELGELSRGFAHLLQEISAYTEYLENFARRLSHEMKTPLAIVRSSLENLALSPQTNSNQTYLDRANEGTFRLGQILHAMSEATRLEKAILQSSLEYFDLRQLVSELADAYQSLDARPHWDICLDKAPMPMTGAPELIAQLLDKLVDNARDFTPEGKQIRLSLQRTASHYVLEIQNEGPLLPEYPAQNIFASFVSLRTQQNSGHLGLGLMIAKLVCDFHDGNISAENLPDQSGVCFRVKLPIERP
ncbi:MAG: hypothetical protein H6999_05915 [Hahellaceae bacterium]|nr:hypothetical protein [Hahellaceae bacterium]MCP5169276.1 hypothetical protein [Hahellaceae bacterium]